MSSPDSANSESCSTSGSIPNWEDGCQRARIRPVGAACSGCPGAVSDSASRIARNRGTSVAGTASSSNSVSPVAACPVLTRSTVSPSIRCSSRASVDTERIRLRGTASTVLRSSPVRSCTSSVSMR